MPKMRRFIEWCRAKLLREQIPQRNAQTGKESACQVVIARELARNFVGITSENECQCGLPSRVEYPVVLDARAFVLPPFRDGVALLIILREDFYDQGRHAEDAVIAYADARRIGARVVCEVRPAPKVRD